MGTVKTITCNKCSKEFKRRSGLDWHLANFAFCRVNQWPEKTNVVEKLPETDPRLLDKNGRPLWGNALKNRIAKIAEQDAKPSKAIKVSASNGSHELSENGGPDNAELDWQSRQEISREFEAMREAFADYKQRIQADRLGIVWCHGFKERIEQELATVVDGKRLIEKQQQTDSEAIAELQIEVARLKDENATHCQLQQSSSETMTSILVTNAELETEIARLKDRVDGNEASIYAIESDHVVDDNEASIYAVESDNNKLTAQVERLIGEQHAINDALLTLIPNPTS